jgi:DNA-directed RNA polymerase subunit H (RpoH/RPB5)
MSNEDLEDTELDLEIEEDACEENAESDVGSDTESSEEELPQEELDADEEPNSDDNRDQQQAFSAYMSMLQCKQSRSSKQKILDTIKSIIHLRGFAVCKKPPAELFNEHAIFARNEKGCLCVFLEHRRPKLKIERAREIHVACASLTDLLQLIITSNNVTSCASKLFDDMKCHVSVFSEEELCRFYIMHMIVPKHVVLSDAEASNFLERKGLKKSQIPNYPLSDPVVKMYAWPTGTLVLCCRNYGGTLQPSLYLRCVNSAKCV